MGARGKTKNTIKDSYKFFESEQDTHSFISLSCYRFVFLTLRALLKKKKFSPWKRKMIHRLVNVKRGDSKLAREREIFGL